MAFLFKDIIISLFAKSMMTGFYNTDNVLIHPLSFPACRRPGGRWIPYCWSTVM